MPVVKCQRNRPRYQQACEQLIAISILASGTNGSLSRNTRDPSEVVSFSWRVFGACVSNLQYVPHFGFNRCIGLVAPEYCCSSLQLLLGVGEAQLSRAESSVGNPSCLGEGVQQHIERRMKSEWAPIERRKFEIGPKWRKWENGRQNGHGGGRMGWQGIGGKGRTLGGGASTTSRGSSVTFDRMP